MQVQEMNQKGTLLHVLQPELRDNSVEDQVLQVIKIGLLCVQQDPKRHPSMSQVVTMLANLDGNLLLEESPTVPFHSASISLALDNETWCHSVETTSEEESTTFSLLLGDSQQPSSCKIGKPTYSLDIQSRADSSFPRSFLWKLVPNVTF